MDKEIKRLTEISLDLEERIKIFTDAYQNFELAIDLENDNEKNLNGEKAQIAEEFYYFCSDNGFLYKNERFNAKNYPNIRKRIEDRIEFLKEKKRINDDLLASYVELENLVKKGEIGEKAISELEAEAEKHYAKGTDEYNRVFNELKKEHIKEQREIVKSNIKEKKDTEKNFKKQNGIRNVIVNAFGPLGKSFYNNIYVPVQNANLNLRKHPVLNVLVKLAAIGAIYVVGTSILGPLHLVSNVRFAVNGCLLLSLGLTVKHTSDYLRKKTLPKKATRIRENYNFKECLERFKTRFNKKNKQKPLYEGIDFTKYVSKAETASEMTTHETSEESTKEKKEDIHDVVEDIEDKTEMKEEKDKETEKEIPDKVDKETEKVMSDKDDEEKETESKKEEKHIEEVKPVKLPPKKSNEKSIYSIKSVLPTEYARNLLNEIDKKNGIETVDEWIAYMNYRKYLTQIIAKTNDKKYIELRDLFDEMGRNISDDLRSRIQSYVTYEQLLDKNKKTVLSARKVKEATLNECQNEYNNLVDMISSDNNDYNVMKNVNFYLDHYDRLITNEQRRYIRQLLEERENRKFESRGRGK